jgi:predicted AAA+ superfamily ATPase
MSKVNVPVLIVAESGSGKSSAARTLPADKTVILNCEAKPMPFKEFTKFKNVNIRKHKDYMKLINELKGEKG